MLGHRRERLRRKPRMQGHGSRVYLDPMQRWAAPDPHWPLRTGRQLVEITVERIKVSSGAAVSGVREDEGSVLSALICLRRLLQPTSSMLDRSNTPQPTVVWPPMPSRRHGLLDQQHPRENKPPCWTNPTCSCPGVELRFPAPGYGHLSAHQAADWEPSSILDRSNMMPPASTTPSMTAPRPSPSSGPISEAISWSL